MEENWKIKYYVSSSGGVSPIYEFIEVLPENRGV